MFQNVIRRSCATLWMRLSTTTSGSVQPYVTNTTTLIAKQNDISHIISTRLMSASHPKYPPLIEDELEEKFTRGGGSGGQAVNVTSNCVVLKHKPTGVVIKCHATRSLSSNRKQARKRLQEALDHHFNGDNSVKALEKQKSILQKQKNKERARIKLEEKRALKASAAAEQASELLSDDSIPDAKDDGVTSSNAEKKS